MRAVLASDHEPPDRTDVRAYLRALYRGVSGYDISHEEERDVRMARGSPTYGEITFAAVEQLADHLALGPGDVFYDLGSGVGKAVLQLAMTRPLRRVVGLELSPSRHLHASAALARARADGKLVARACAFVHGDILDAPLADATVAYTCSTAFSDSFMRKLVRKLAALRPGLRFVTTRHPIVRHGFVETAELRLDMSWHRRSPVYIYELPAS